MICGSEKLKGGMPFSGRPLRTTGPILFPSISCVTNFDLVRSGPLSPPLASRPWQKEQSRAKRVLPFWTRSGEYDLDEATPLGLTLLPLCLLFAGVCSADTATVKNK